MGKVAGKMLTSPVQPYFAPSRAQFGIVGNSGISLYPKFNLRSDPLIYKENIGIGELLAADTTGDHRDYSKELSNRFLRVISRDASIASSQLFSLSSHRHARESLRISSPIVPPLPFIFPSIPTPLPLTFSPLLPSDTTLSRA